MVESSNQVQFVERMNIYNNQFVLGLESLVERLAGRRQSDTGMAKWPPMALCSTHTLAILRLVLSMSQFRERMRPEALVFYW